MIDPTIDTSEIHTASKHHVTRSLPIVRRGPKGPEIKTVGTAVKHELWEWYCLACPETGIRYRPARAVPAGVA